MKAFLINVSLLCLIVCTGNAQKTARSEPVNNFEYLWQLFDQHYASFPEKQINWDEVYREYRPKISATTSEIELLRTLSAADVLALMMSQLPQVTLVGEPSNGSYSDLMAEKLPNGWTVTLSHQRYLSLEKKNYEGKGTPVDIRVENSLEAIREGEDEVLSRAIQLLTTGE